MRGPASAMLGGIRATLTEPAVNNDAFLRRAKVGRLVAYI